MIGDTGYQPVHGRPDHRADIGGGRLRRTRRRHGGHRLRREPRRGFTLIELLVTIAIIVILASTVLFALYGAMEEARAHRTRSQVTRIHELLVTRWDEYRSRPVPLRISAGVQPRVAAQMRLQVLREIQRMEFPDRKTDVIDGVTAIYYQDVAPNGQFINVIRNSGLSPAAPSLWRSYNRFVASKWGPAWASIAEPSGWTRQHQGAECLYMILANMRDGGSSALEFLKPNEVGDTDGDLMPEVLDGWGNPIEFIRWPAGFTLHPGADGEWGVAGVDDDGPGVDDDGDGQVDEADEIDDPAEVNWLPSDDGYTPGYVQQVPYSDLMSRDTSKSADPFDIMKVDWRWRDRKTSGEPVFTNQPFALYPLVFSAGRDQIYDILTDLPVAVRYRQTQRPNPAGGAPVPFPNDPYVVLGNNGAISILMGAAGDDNADGIINARDNIHNHLIEVR